MGRLRAPLVRISRSPGRGRRRRGCGKAFCLSIFFSSIQDTACPKNKKRYQTFLSGILAFHPNPNSKQHKEWNEIRVLSLSQRENQRNLRFTPLPLQDTHRTGALSTAPGQAASLPACAQSAQEKAAGQTEKQMNLFFGWPPAFLMPGSSLGVMQATDGSKFGSFRLPHRPLRSRR